MRNFEGFPSPFRSDTPIIIWQGDWIPRVNDPLIRNQLCILTHRVTYTDSTFADHRIRGSWMTYVIGDSKVVADIDLLFKVIYKMGKPPKKTGYTPAKTKLVTQKWRHIWKVVQFLLSMLDFRGVNLEETNMAVQIQLFQWEIHRQMVDVPLLC